jgi:hypothetical protein
MGRGSGQETGELASSSGVAGNQKQLNIKVVSLCIADVQGIC